jgi:hypothetical protein
MKRSALSLLALTLACGLESASFENVWPAPSNLSNKGVQGSDGRRLGAHRPGGR